jgi:dihydroorotate dehydrogenase
LFERTVALVKRYKKLLDRRPPPLTKYAASRAEKEDIKIKGSLREGEKSHGASTNTTSRNPVDSVQPSVDTGLIALHEEQSASKQPPFNPPKERFFDQASDERDRLRPTKENLEQTTTADQAKVIFASGGITNGKQALEVLNAGASVVMIYTALVYGGVGTISRIKGEMREEIRAGKTTKKKALPS